jgi:glycine cleavage system H lipoate-binding protein
VGPKSKGDVATIGITKYAADALGEIVYVDLAEGRFLHYPHEDLRRD